MNSSDLAEEGFDAWLPLEMAHERETLTRIPAQPGTFAIRRRGVAPTEPEVVYVGVGANRLGLKLRVRQIFHPGPSQATNQRLLSLIQGPSEYEIAVSVHASGDAARAHKARLQERLRRDQGGSPSQDPGE